jgi:uncharacterized protein YbjT (DUF2867 family)
MPDRLVTVFGGSGFLGRHLVRALARRDYRIRVAVRRPDLAGHLQPLGRVGQIHAVQANVRYPDSVTAAVRHADVVINLVGILFERGRQRFPAVHVAGADAVARAAVAVGARMIHVSAIGADANSPSGYARTKAAGEAAVRAAVPAATTFRPSILFGPEDDFFNRFAAMARLSPVMPVICGATKLQPVYVGDVADAAMAALAQAGSAGAIYELGGPRVWTFHELLSYIMQETDRHRMMLNVPMGLARLQALFLELVPGKPLTRDQLLMLSRDNVVAVGAPGLAELGLVPTPVELVVPGYLRRFQPGGGRRRVPPEQRHGGAAGLSLQARDAG